MEARTSGRYRRDVALRARRPPIAALVLLLAIVMAAAACSTDAGAAGGSPGASLAPSAAASSAATATAAPRRPAPTRVPVATVAPPAPIVALVPFGAMSKKTVQSLAAYYEETYDITVTVLPAAPIEDAARDRARGQLIAEELVKTLRYDYPETTANRSAVLIGVVDEDLYIRKRSDWAWAFGLRSLGRFAIVSTARMDAPNGSASTKTQTLRLRKMVTKYIGLMYFDLEESEDPKSVLYGDIGGIADLDGMGEKLNLP